MSKLIEYKIKETIPLKETIHLDDKCLIKSEYIDITITDRKIIYIKLDQEKCTDAFSFNFYRTYHSLKGFSLRDIILKIKKTYRSYAEIYDDNYCDDLLLTSFKYDPTNLIVYPDTHF